MQVYGVKGAVLIEGLLIHEWASARAPQLDLTSLQLFASGCGVLQYFVVFCSVVQCGAAWCSVLQCVAVCCSVLQLLCRKLWGSVCAKEPYFQSKEPYISPKEH